MGGTADGGGPGDRQDRPGGGVPPEPGTGAGAGPQAPGGGEGESPGPEPAAAGLSERDRAVLDLARRTWVRPGAKERAIRERLGMSATRYYQVLNALIDTPEALAHDPVTVNRLRRMREARRGRR